MSYKANVYTIMISAPSDCTIELQHASEVIHKWNAINARTRKLVLLPVDWKNNTMPKAGTLAQDNINKQITFHADALIAIFKNRIGTPTGKHQSGTIEEIHEVVSTGKHVLLYFSDEQVDRSLINSEQIKSIQVYRASCSTKDHYATYCGIQDFSSKLDLHLGILANQFCEECAEIIQEQPSMPPANALSINGSQSLTEEASELLLAAVSDDGVIMVAQYIGGEIIQAGSLSREFGKNDARQRAKYEAAIEELEYYGMVRPEGYERKMFKVTSVGYTHVDKLNA